MAIQAKPSKRSHVRSALVALPHGDLELPTPLTHKSFDVTFLWTVAVKGTIDGEPFKGKLHLNVENSEERTWVPSAKPRGTYSLFMNRTIRVRRSALRAGQSLDVVLEHDEEQQRRDDAARARARKSCRSPAPERPSTERRRRRG